MKKFFKEKLHANLVQEIKIKKILVNTRSKFQKIEIFDTYIFGRIMALDGIIQITEKDESAYSEMLVHPIVQTSLNKPKKTLIIGGGDGAVAEELLKYSFIKKIDLVDIDKKVIDLCKKYFKKINNNSLSNKKVSLFYDDAFNFCCISVNCWLNISTVPRLFCWDSIWLCSVAIWASASVARLATFAMRSFMICSICVLVYVCSSLIFFSLPDQLFAESKWMAGSRKLFK